MSRIHAIESDTNDFALLTLPDKLRTLLPFAILSPSSRNSQPWRFHVDDRGVSIYGDEARTLPIADPECRELAMSIGAVAHRLGVAMRAHGMEPNVRYVSDIKQPSLVAQVEYTGDHVTTESDRRKMSLLRSRRSVEDADTAHTVTPETLANLTAAAAESGCQLTWIGHGSLRRTVADMLERAELRLYSETSYRHELSEWVHPDNEEAHDGIPARVIGLSGIQSLFAPWIVRHFDMGKRASSEDRAKAISSPALGALLSEDDTPSDWIKAGAALSDVLIEACSRGLSCELFDAALELPGIRSRVKDAMGTNKFPQAILRLAFAPEGKHLPRRPIRSFLNEDQAGSI